MYGANVTMRSLKNTNTCIDITVPTIQEVEAPLGGTSTEYEISVLTTLDLYKSHLHSKEDVIHFSVFKAYKEVEDFYDKVVKKFSDVDIPSIPKGRLISKFSVEDKRSSLDKFMKEISQHKEICDSPFFLQFLGINKHRKSRSSISETFSEVSLHDSGVSSPGSVDQSSQLNSHTEESPPLYNNTAKKNNVNDKKDETENDDQLISELFPKMKVRKSSKPDVVDEENNIKDDFCPTLSPEMEESGRTSFEDEDLDLFEEAKNITKEEKGSKRTDSNKSAHQGLFDYFEDDSSRLFLPPQIQNKYNDSLDKSSETYSNKSNKSVAIKEDISDEDAPDLFKFELEASPQPKVQSGQASNLFKSNRLFGDEDEMDSKMQIPGDISLFGEQDFGTSITKDDEELFFVAKSDDKNIIVNTLLSPTVDTVPDDGVTETLDELITLPEPSAELPKIESKPVIKEKQTLPPKPTPKPRMKSNASSESKEKPPVLPRKVPTKPSLPPKPVPPPKPKPSSAAQKQPEVAHPSVVTKNQANNTLDNFSSLDILQYIEQEEKIANSEAGLFD